MCPARTAKTYETSASQADFHKPEQTLIVYDWDDTLCPSCWIQDNQPPLSFFRPPPRQEKWLGPLRQLEKLVEGLLLTSMRLGEVVIVTNAQEPWVEQSCRNFLPGVEPLLRKIPVIYAHAVYDELGIEEAQGAAAASRVQAELNRQATLETSSHSGLPGAFAASPEGGASVGTVLTGGTGGSSPGLSPGGAPGMYNRGGRRSSERDASAQLTRGTTNESVDLEVAPQRWKEAAFRRELKRFYSRYKNQSWKNIVSVGDSHYERDAIREVILGRPTKTKRCRTKTAKMLDEPTIEELIKQVKVIHDGISMMVHYDGNIDIEIDEKDIEFDMKAIERMATRDR
eukprot:gnl/TRDRNA2_/TRDRNA2_80727_c0_seq1.p1 gnl/TRDRNA2_/TRDRNA2_80727_c0~~gnl/TRDRNA2_/TRDRNA2_80727_c0_seq1.p1  ORF type:complete len:371 (-),score=75.84 gnl/TRDRNA2_/TRDRNA2_80727_c0_seq1:62-1087(-)